MRADTATGPPDLRVQRRAEINRLAKDCQARAYEELLPIIRRCRPSTAATAEAEMASTPCQRSLQKGVAA
jgi:hypothetical protein